MKRLFFCLLMAFVAVMPLRMQAQIIDPVKWTFAIEDLNENEFDLVATATVDPQYHIYSTKMPDLGPLPTVFEFEPSSNYEIVGEARDVNPGEKFYDDIFEVEYVQFKGTAVYAQRLKKLTDQPFTVVGTITGQACKDGMCVPVSGDFSVNVAGANGSMVAENAVVPIALAIRMVSVTSEKTVGLMKSPLSSMAEPPHSSLAPSFFPLSIRSRILSNCFWSICKTERSKLGFFLDAGCQGMCPTASYVVADLIMF